MERFLEIMEKEAESLSTIPGSVLLTKQKFDRIVEHLNQPENKVDAYFRQWVKKRQFSLMNVPEIGLVNVLVVPNEKDKDAGSASYLRVLHAENVVSLLHHIHATELKHSGYKKVLDFSQRYYQGTTRDFVQKFCSQCPTCQLSAPQISRPPLKPIIEKDFMERIQIDLIDMRHSPDGDYHYIAHFMDHFSKFHVLFSLRTKSAAEVAMLLEQRVLAYFGPPKIFHSDNGREFVNQLIRALFKSWGGQVTFVNGRPRHSQSQGLVERGNRTVEMKIAAMKVDEGCDSDGNYPWASWLPKIMFSLNSEVQRTTNEPPYKVVFGKLPPTGLFPGAESILEEEDVHRRQDESNQQLLRPIPKPRKSLRPVPKPRKSLSLSEANLNPIPHVSTTDTESQTHFSATDLEPQTHMSEKDPEPQTPMSVTDTDPQTHLSETDTEPQTHLSATDTDPQTYLSATDTDPQTYLSVTDTEPQTHLSVTDSEPQTHLSATDPEPQTHLSVTDSEPQTHLSATDPEPQTYLSVTDTEPQTRLSVTDSEPQTHLSATDPEPQTYLSVTDSEPQTHLSVTDPEPQTHLSETDSEPNDRHTLVRKRVYRKTVEAAERMEHFYNRRKRIKIANFRVGETVSVAIPKLDRASTDLKRLPAIISQVHGMKRQTYSLATQYGRLKSKHLAGDLEKFTGEVMPDLTREITIRAAAKQKHPENQFTKNYCNCVSGCKSKRCPCRDKKITCSTHCHYSNACQNDGPQIIKVFGLMLSQKDILDLQSSTTFLNDNHINAAQRILQNQFPEVNGLQDTLLQQNSSFNIQQGPFIQIFHKQNHWITISRDASNKQIKIYDSLRQVPDKNLTEIVAKYILSDDDVIEFAVMNNQLQGVVPDCGPFAVAFAASLMCGEDPTQIEYERSQVRHHLRQCIETQNFVPFPSRPKFRSTAVVSSSRIKIHCICRCPDNGSLMIKCNACNLLFHTQCVGQNTQRQSKDAAKSWLCPKCSCVRKQ